MTRTLRLLLMFAVAAALHAQNWVPTRIVAITQYLPLAKMARASGDVIIKCSLNADGSVAKAEVVSGHSLLKEQARTNALLWKFKRVASAAGGDDDFVLLTYQYRLEDELQDPAVGHTTFYVDLPGTVHVIAPVDYVTP